MKTSVLQSFTSGVVSIAATIMVLQLTTPASGDFSGIFNEWPTLLGHFNSFFIIYILWYFHAKEVERTEYIPPDVVLLNGLWLIFLAIIPFVTGWIEKFPNSTLPHATFSVLFLICVLLNALLLKKLIKDTPNVQFSSRLSFKQRWPIYLLLVLAIINSFLFPFLDFFIELAIVIYMVALILIHRKDDVFIF